MCWWIKATEFQSTYWYWIQYIEKKLPARLYEAGSYNHKSINHYVGIGLSSFETDRDNMLNLLLPAIKTIAVSYSYKTFQCYEGIGI